MSEADQMVEIESVTSPDWSGRVNRAKYMAMRDALLPVLPSEAPGMTVAEAKAALLPNLSEDLFPVCFVGTCTTYSVILFLKNLRPMAVYCQSFLFGL